METTQKIQRVIDDFQEQFDRAQDNKMGATVLYNLEGKLNGLKIALAILSEEIA